MARGIYLKIPEDGKAELYFVGENYGAGRQAIGGL